MDFLLQMDTLACSYLTRIIIAVFALLIGYLLVKTLKALTFRVLEGLKIDVTLACISEIIIGDVLLYLHVHIGTYDSRSSFNIFCRKCP